MDSFVSLVLSIRNVRERDRSLDHVIDPRTIRSALIPSLGKDLSIITHSKSRKSPLYLPFLALTVRSLCSITCVKPTPTSHSWYCEKVLRTAWGAVFTSSTADKSTRSASPRSSSRMPSSMTTRPPNLRDRWTLRRMSCTWSAGKKCRMLPRSAISNCATQLHLRHIAGLVAHLSCYPLASAIWVVTASTFGVSTAITRTVVSA